MSRPSKWIAPASLPRLPEICPIKVVLPAPFGPIRACTSPRFTSSVTSSVATMPPKRLDTFFSSSMLFPREHAGDALGGEQHDRSQHASLAVGTVLLAIVLFAPEGIAGMLACC